MILLKMISLIPGTTGGVVGKIFPVDKRKDLLGFIIFH